MAFLINNTKPIVLITIQHKYYNCIVLGLSWIEGSYMSSYLFFYGCINVNIKSHNQSPCSEIQVKQTRNALNV